jgi:hypothetical protein
LRALAKIPSALTAGVVCLAACEGAVGAGTAAGQTAGVPGITA